MDRASIFKYRSLPHSFPTWWSSVSLFITLILVFIVSRKYRTICKPTFIEDIVVRVRSGFREQKV